MKSHLRYADWWDALEGARSGVMGLIHIAQDAKSSAESGELILFVFHKWKEISVSVGLKLASQELLCCMEVDIYFTRQEIM
jgi:hypothetical protein